MKSIITLLIVTSSFCCYSTVQHKDILCYDGETYGLKDYYLEDYFEKHPKKKPKTEISSTALWRGYIATYTVYDNQIYLTDLQIQVQDKSSNEIFATKWKSVFKDFSPNSDRFLIKWINDLILLPIGVPIDYEDGYGITHSQYEIIEIKNGIIVDNFAFSLKKYKKIFENRNPYFLGEKELRTLKKELKE